MNDVLIVSMGKYPNGNAGALRQHAFAKLFKQIGYKPHVIGMGDSTNFKTESYDNVDFTSFREKNNTLRSRILNILFFKKRLKKFLNNNHKYSTILVVSVFPEVLWYLKKYSRKNGIKLIHDSVEWYSPGEFKGRKFSISYQINNLYNTKWIDKQFGVIAISKFLESHFTSRGIRSVRIPVILDINEMSSNKRQNPEKIVLIYAGAAGKKDYIMEVVEGLSLLNEEDINKIELRIIGLDTEQLTQQVGVPANVIRKVENSLKCYGRVSREKVLKNLEEADFTVLLRPSNQRYAKAGFPTKVVESLGSATPVICNITSDLGDFIHDGGNGIIVDDCTALSFSKGLNKVLRLSYEDRKKMQYNSRLTAEKNFDYRLYEKELIKLL